MKAKPIVTTVLLAFVAASVIYLVLKETEGQPAASVPSTATSVAEPQQAAMSEVAAAAKAGPKLIAYYFHGNMRCMTCRTIEAYAKEAVETGFPEALKHGRLEFRVVNVEEPSNEHFVQDYQLTTRSVVLVQFADGKQEQWKNLERVWELVRDKKTFLKYVQDETRSYLEAAD